MSDDEKPISLRDDGAHEPPSRAARVLGRAQRAGAMLAGEALDRIGKQAGQVLLPKLEAALDWMTSPDNIEQVQAIMARTAQSAIDMGFRVDHHAALLFEFVDWMEQEHGRDPVAARVWQYNSLIDGTLLALLEARVGMVGQQDRGRGYERQLEAVRLDFLEMLCSLASLEDERTMPRVRRPETLRAYFEDCILPERFYVLAGLGVGDPAAFDEMERRLAEQQEREREERSMAGKLVDRLRRAANSARDDLPGALQDTDADEDDGDRRKKRSKRARAKALVKLGPFDRDPSFRFLVNSYLFFLQTYTTRALIERFPETIATARALDEQMKERQAAASSTHEKDVEAGEVIDLAE
jgi:hypothetical protein